MGNGNKSKWITSLPNTKKNKGTRGHGFSYKHNPIFTKKKKKRKKRVKPRKK